MSPRLLAIALGLFFLLPEVVWFATQRWWDRSKSEKDQESALVNEMESEGDPFFG